MAKRIHFEDDIFYLRTRIRTALDAIALDIDPELFLNDFVEDLGFIDATLELLLRALLENDKLMERNEQLLNLAETEDDFGELIDSVLNGRGALAEAVVPFSDRIREFRLVSRQRRSETDGVTDAATDNEEEPVVSPIELNELLKGME